MKRDTLARALLAFAIMSLVTPIPLVGILPAALVVGTMAGWAVARAQGAGPATGGIWPGARVGAAALLGIAVGLTILGFILGSVPLGQIGLLLVVAVASGGAALLYTHYWAANARA